MDREKELRVLEAAKTVFLRHGFRRVTMGDIAEEAGMSRPALYLLFPNKEEIFKAAIRQIAGENLTTIGAGLGAQAGEIAKLRFAFAVWVVGPYKLMLQSPDARELIDCTHGFAREEMEGITAQFHEVLVGILKPLVPRRRKTGMGAREVARILNAAVHGFKEEARTVEALQEMIDGLIGLVVAGLRG